MKDFMSPKGREASVRRHKIHTCTYVRWYCSWTHSKWEPKLHTYHNPPKTQPLLSSQVAHTPSSLSVSESWKRAGSCLRHLGQDALEHSFFFSELLAESFCNGSLRHALLVVATFLSCLHEVCFFTCSYFFFSLSSCLCFFSSSLSLFHHWRSSLLFCFSSAAYFFFNSSSCSYS